MATLAKYRAAAPSKTEIFQSGKGGQRIAFNCWIGESILVQVYKMKIHFKNNLLNMVTIFVVTMFFHAKSDINKVQNLKKHLLSLQVKLILLT